MSRVDISSFMFDGSDDIVFVTNATVGWSSMLLALVTRVDFAVRLLQVPLLLDRITLLMHVSCIA